MADADNLFSDMPAKSPGEVFERLAGGEHVLIERIVSHGQATPAGTWLRQDRHEWIVLLRGRARLEFRDGRLLHLTHGSHLLIPGGTEHRVAMTAPDGPTVWLAVHFSQ